MPEIEYRVRGQVTRIQADPRDTLLDSALRNGVDAPYSCLEGVCQTCRARLIQGQVVAPHGSGFEPEADGTILTCQMLPHPNSSHLVVEYV